MATLGLMPAPLVAAVAATVSAYLALVRVVKVRVLERRLHHVMA
jgi:hypothetical protein